MPENEVIPTVRERRVGTITFGAVLILTGIFMAAALFYPELQLEFLLKLCPLILISLGVEVLLSARKGGRIRYDWVGMVLCCLILCAALVMFAAAWVTLYHPEFFRYW